MGKVIITLTVAEARALSALAENSAYSDGDAPQILHHPARVAAGFRAIQKLDAAIYRRAVHAQKARGWDAGTPAIARAEGKEGGQ